MRALIDRGKVITSILAPNDWLWRHIGVINDIVKVELDINFELLYKC